MARVSSSTRTAISTTRTTPNNRNGVVVFCSFNNTLINEVDGTSLTITVGTSSYVSDGPFGAYALRLENGVAKAKLTLPSTFYRDGTVILWGRPNSFTGSNQLWHATPSYQSPNMIRALIDATNKRVDGIYLDEAGNDRSAYSNNNGVTQSVWNFICMAWKREGTVDMWNNANKKVGGVASSIKKSSNDFWLGSRSDTTACNWDFSHLIIFNRKLSDVEITAYQSLTTAPKLKDILALPSRTVA